ncbi:CRAL-TRIO domain-containing protein [Xylariaceae sp. FL0804]|nr:CRAL-TRIO domain-containing protein [Xylariaceae sp. FL0804]
MVYIHGADRLGRPIGYIHVALHRPSAQSARVMEKLVVQTIETARCMFAPGRESACVVFDLTGFSLANMEWHIVKFIIRCFEANYPECLGVLLIHNAPWIFSGIWKVIRGLLDPVVKAKVNFTKNVEELERWIPRENIIKALGGREDWTYHYREPAADEDAQMEQTGARDKIMAERREIADELLAATRAWLTHVTAGGETAEAAAQQARRETAAASLRANYWELDPYIRSRTQLDRTGVIKPDGKVEIYPERKAVPATTTETGTETVFAREKSDVSGAEQVAVAS